MQKSHGQQCFRAVTFQVSGLRVLAGKCIFGTFRADEVQKSHSQHCFRATTIWPRVWQGSGLSSHGRVRPGSTGPSVALSAAARSGGVRSGGAERGVGVGRRQDRGGGGRCSQLQGRRCILAVPTWNVGFQKHLRSSFLHRCQPGNVGLTGQLVAQKQPAHAAHGRFVVPQIAVTAWTGHIFFFTLCPTDRTEQVNSGARRRTSATCRRSKLGCSRKTVAAAVILAFLNPQSVLLIHWG